MTIRIFLAIILTIIFVCCSKNDDTPKEAESNYLSYQTQTELELPFDEEWFIAWGGRAIEQNYHAENREQRFAMDIAQKIHGRTSSGDGNKNEDYYCFGKTIYAPGSGKIVSMENSVNDNSPGVLNTKQPLGNYIVIDHQNGEYSFLVHFKQGSIIINVDDDVVMGQELGKIGNSGNSSESHLHFHMQTTSYPFNGEGLPTQFLNYYANDVLIERGEPVKDEFIRRE